jgi:hypothetical protein
MVVHFEGKCDVCGSPISIDWDSSGGMIDYEIDGNKMVTWIRHYATAPPNVNPDCARYSSKVLETKRTAAT